jgi:hypothetical protein
VDERRVEQRIAEAASILPPRGAVTGWASLRWQGGAWFSGEGREGPLPVPLAMMVHARRPRAGVLLSEERLSPSDVLVVDGVAVTSAVRSTCFEMRYASSLRDAVRVLDMSAYNDLVSLDEAAAYALDHPGWTGIPQCREAIGLSAENSWSPTETDTRVTWQVDANLPRPLCNVPLFDLHGRHLGTPDLIEPRSGVVCEYDGSLHLAGAQRLRDVRRDETYRAVGLEVVVVLGDDLANRDRLATRMRSAVAAASRRPVDARRWTLQRPAWWRDTDTVEQRRALSDEDRRRWLRYRLQAG